MGNKPPPHKPGKSKFTQRRVKQLVRYIGDGMPMMHACRAVDINLQTFHNWMAKGEEDPDSGYGDFRRLILEAEARLPRLATRTMGRMLADEQTPPATRAKLATFVAERTLSEKYGQRTQVQVDQRSVSVTVDVGDRHLRHRGRLGDVLDAVLGFDDDAEPAALIEADEE